MSVAGIGRRATPRSRFRVQLVADGCTGVCAAMTGEALIGVPVQAAAPSTWLPDGVKQICQAHQTSNSGFVCDQAGKAAATLFHLPLGRRGTLRRMITGCRGLTNVDRGEPKRGTYRGEPI